MTTTALTTRESTRLQTAINRAHEQVGRAATDMVGHAVNCGQLLLEAKGKVPHGSWAPWVEEHFEGSTWTARKYMQLAQAEEANRGSITEMPSIITALRSLASPRQQDSEASPGLDPDSEAGRMLGSAKALVRGTDSDEPGFVEAEAIEVAPSGVEERRWNNALRRMDEVRRCMTEAVKPGLASDAAAGALQEASTAARQIAIELEQMANAARRRVA